MYCRINLAQTNYKEIPYTLLDESAFDSVVRIYKSYAQLKGFESVLPLFYEEISSPITEVLGYYDRNNTLQAFSLIYRFLSQKSCVAEQFAWTYHDPKTKLGYRSIRSECARYKRLGFKYLYLGETAPYKEQLKGFELI